MQMEIRCQFWPTAEAKTDMKEKSTENTTVGQTMPAEVAPRHGVPKVKTWMEFAASFLPMDTRFISYPRERTIVGDSFLAKSNVTRVVSQ